jgi:hypothetical protein
VRTYRSSAPKELETADAAGYLLMGMTVGKTAIGGKELLAIMRRSDAP